jgi:hypothetical protein
MPMARAKPEIHPSLKTALSEAITTVNTKVPMTNLTSLILSF